MFEEVLSFFDRHRSFILTTHDPPDADGLGAELVIASILTKMGKSFKIINASATPELFRFMDNRGLIEEWNVERHGSFPGQSAFVVLDTSDEYHTGDMKEILNMGLEVFSFDHHEHKAKTGLRGFIDSSASSTSELAVELALLTGTNLDVQTAMAAYTGIVYDSGFFAYSKTSMRTFNAAIKTIECGADPVYVYKQLMETFSCGALLLQKRTLSTLELHDHGRIAVQIIRGEDLEAAGASFEDAEGFVNIPLRVKDIEVSILIKEKSPKEIRCSLRSKGKVNVSKIAQNFGGGGHIAAAGLKSSLSPEETLAKLLVYVEACLDPELTANKEGK